MKCSKCGFENPNESSYCMNCGNRLDGKIQCPNCRSLVDPSANHCPNCGTKIPHETILEPSKNEEKFNSYRNRKAHVWNIALTAVFVGLFALALLINLGPIVEGDPSKATLFGEGSVLYYLSFEWGEAIKNAANTTDPINKYAAIALPTYRALLCLFDIVGVYVAGVYGIVKGINQLRKGKECQFNLHYQAAIVFVVMLVTTSRLVATYASYSVDQFPPDTATIYGLFLAGMAIACIAAIVYKIMYTFDRQKKSLLVQNIIFSIGFIVCLSLIALSSNTYLTFRNNQMSSEYNTINAGLSLTFFDSFIGASTATEATHSLSVTHASLSGIAVILELTIIAAAGVYTLFFTKSMFEKKPEELKFKIPCFFGSILIFSLSVFLLFINISDMVVMKAILTRRVDAFTNSTEFNALLRDDTVDVIMGGSILEMVSSAFFILGTSTASFFITKSYNKNRKLINSQKE